MYSTELNHELIDLVQLWKCHAQFGCYPCGGSNSYNLKSSQHRQCMYTIEYQIIISAIPLPLQLFGDGKFANTYLPRPPEVLTVFWAKDYCNFINVLCGQEEIVYNDFLFSLSAVSNANANWDGRKNEKHYIWMKTEIL